jgi:hypothetical protein
VGEQRLKVFEKAADILNNSLKISAPVFIQCLWANSVEYRCVVWKIIRVR